MRRLIIAGMLIIILAVVSQVQASNHKISAVFITPYNGTLFFCLSTNPPQYNNCVEGFRQIRVYTPDPAHNNELYIHTCFQFIIWICDNGFWMTQRDIWYTETVDFPHLKWATEDVVRSYTDTPEIWNKLLMGYNKYIPITFGPWGDPEQPAPYPAPEEMGQPSSDSMVWPAGIEEAYP